MAARDVLVKEFSVDGGTVLEALQDVYQCSVSDCAGIQSCLAALLLSIGVWMVRSDHSLWCRQDALYLKQVGNLSFSASAPCDL